MVAAVTDREQIRRDAESYRVEADCAMRDYDALELEAGILRDALSQIAEGRRNEMFDPWARETAKNALAQTPIIMESA